MPPLQRRHFGNSCVCFTERLYYLLILDRTDVKGVFTSTIYKPGLSAPRSLISTSLVPFCVVRLCCLMILPTLSIIRIVIGSAFSLAIATLTWSLKGFGYTART